MPVRDDADRTEIPDRRIVERHLDRLQRASRSLEVVLRDFKTVTDRKAA